MKFDILADQKVIDTTSKALKAKGYEVLVVPDKAAALAKIKTLIPQGASLMNGASVTLEQIGFVDYLKAGVHGWNNLHEAVLKEKDPEKQKQLRRQAVVSDYYLGSVHALTQTGEFLIASNSGSQLPHVVFTSSNLIFVVGTQKIVPDLDMAMKRLKEYVVPLEDKHMKALYGMGTNLSKILIFNSESPFTKRTIHLILVKEKLGI